MDDGGGGRMEDPDSGFPDPDPKPDPGLSSRDGAGVATPVYAGLL